MKKIILLLLIVGTSMFILFSCQFFITNKATIKIRNNVLGSSGLDVINVDFHDVYLNIKEPTEYKQEKKDIAYNKDHTFTITWKGLANTDVSVISGSSTITIGSNPTSPGEGKTLCTISDVKNGANITKTITYDGAEKVSC